MPTPPPGSASTNRTFRADDRTMQLIELRDGLRRDQRAIEGSYAELAEVMATTSRRLAETARAADFSPPAWPGEIGRTLEIRLSETREITFRLGGHSSDPRRDEPSQD